MHLNPEFLCFASVDDRQAMIKGTIGKEMEEGLYKGPANDNRPGGM
jgi:hypothetical protein